MIYCTERDTRLIYEVQMFDKYALVRPAARGVPRQIDKIDYAEYNRRFEDCGVSAKTIDEVLDGEIEVEAAKA